MSFGDLLASHRRHIGLTQQALAKVAGCSSSVLSRLEKGRTPKTREVVLAIGRALELTGTELDDFLGAAGFASLTKTDQINLSTQLVDVRQEVAALRNLLQAGQLPLLEHYAVIRPVLDALSESLMLNEYAQHAAAQQEEKRAVAEWIVRKKNLIRDDCRLALDTGSTIVQVACQIVQHHLPLKETYTNNFIAATILLARQDVVYLAGGKVNTASARNSYGAMLGPWAERTCQEFPADVTLIGASGLKADTGPYAPTAEDCAWKRSLIAAAVEHRSSIIVPVDYTKLVHVRARDRQVFQEPSDWKALREKVLVVTAGEPDSVEEREQLEEVVKEFAPSMVRVPLQK